MEIPLKGSIRNTNLVKLLVYLSRNRKTGTLSLATPAYTKKIFLHEGDAIFASSTCEDDRLGEMLLKANKLTFEQYNKSVELLKTSGKRQGAILVELGYLTPKDLFWGVKYQVKEIIRSMFVLEEGEYVFEVGVIPTQEVITLKMSMGNLIHEGVKKIENWTRIRQELPDPESVFKISDDPLSLFQNIELSTQDKKILSLIDGQKTIKEVIEQSWMGSFEAMKILYVLWSIGIVELKSSALPEVKKGETLSIDEILKPQSEEDDALLKRIDDVYSRLEGISITELLEVDETSDKDSIKRNYYRLAKEFHPDRYFAISDFSVKAKLTAIFDAITQAYNILKDDTLLAEYFSSRSHPSHEQATDSRENVEELFRRGIGEFKKSNFWGAIDNFKQASRLAPGNATYWNYLSLAYSKIPGRLKDSEEAILEAVRLDPSNSDFYANMGLIYLKAGLSKRAQNSFEKALTLDPKNEKAFKGLTQAKVKH